MNAIRVSLGIHLFGCAKHETHSPWLGVAVLGSDRRAVVCLLLYSIVRFIPAGRGRTWNKVISGSFQHGIHSKVESIPFRISKQTFNHHFWHLLFTHTREFLQFPQLSNPSQNLIFRTNSVACPLKKEKIIRSQF